MQQYPNYYPNQMASQFQPNFNQQMQNPYMDRIAQLQNFQMQNQRPVATINGRFVQSAEEVNASDVAMDGSMSLFPKADMTEIYGKAWMANGQTRILTFKPVLDNDPNTLSQNEEKLNFETLGQVLEGIQSDIKTLTEKLDKISKPTRQRKEVSEDE